MPIEEYYKGRGRRVMREMQERYGKERGERIFYATAKARGLEPTQKKRKKRRHNPGNPGPMWVTD